MLTTESLGPDELLRLRVFVTVEFPHQITPAVVAGGACAWCGNPPGANGLPLEYVKGFDVRGCADCYSVRLQWVLSWDTWAAHFLACDVCQRGEHCRVAQAQRLLHEQTISAAGKEPMHCYLCHQQVTGDERVTAAEWHGMSGMHLGYAHVAHLCLAPNCRVISFRRRS